MRLSRPDTVLLGLILLFVAAVLLMVCVWDLPHLSLLFAQGPTGDAAQYNAGGASIVRQGIYSMDGVHPYAQREIGYSLFLAIVYFFSGLNDYVAVFVVQVALFLVAVIVLEHMLRRFFSATVSLIATALLLLLPSVLLLPFLLIREAITLSFLLLFAAAFLKLVERPSVIVAMTGGLCLGFAMLTYGPLLLLPIFLCVFAWWLPVSWKYLSIIAVCAYLVIAPWMARNMIEFHMPCPTGCYRDALQWYVRGVRSENIRGLEPYRCLWSEYISRDWTGRSPYCSFNAVWHAKWPNGLFGTPQELADTRAAQMQILHYFPYYLWDSVSEVVEFHLPFVGPWGKIYNSLDALGLLILYIGCLLALPVLLRPNHRFFLLVALYCIALFALTDATPRYHMPVIFCYAVIASIGYHRLLTRLHLCPP